MAGSIGLSLQQQFDKTNGRLLTGGKLYFYSAGTSAPQNVFKDQSLTLPFPNPITLGSDARIPAFYVADGSVRARLVSKSGVVQFDADNILVVGPSSGEGGGGGVDATTVFQVGDVMWLDVTGTRSGWVRDNGRTIGSSTSGASERANSDCQPLFLYLWQTYADSICPVLTGRGASSAADWAANKQITLPDKRGYVIGGLDDMGNSTAGRYANVPVASGSTTTAGSVLGETSGALVQANLPDISLPVTDPKHHHSLAGGTPVRLLTTEGGPADYGSGSFAPVSATQTSEDATNISVRTGGSGQPVSKVQKTVIGTFYRKL